MVVDSPLGGYWPYSRFYLLLLTPGQTECIPSDPTLTLGMTTQSVRKESDDIILGVAFDSKMTFEKYFH